MSLHQPNLNQEDPTPQNFWKSKAGIVAVGFLLIGLFFLLSEHWAHVFGVVPYLLILACPLMHIFMHRGHGDHHGSDHHHERHKHEPDRGVNR